jgi:hypothetical protein
MSDTIICPKCKYEIEVTEVLSSQLREQLRKEFDAELRKKEQDFQTKADGLRKREQELEASKQALDAEVQARLTKEKGRLDKEAVLKAKEAVALELQAKEEELTQARSKLQEAQKAELDLRKRATELEDQKREMDLVVARKMDEERQKIRDQAKKEATDERALKEAEKDKVIDDLRKQISDWQRKAEQGSQQTQGEVLELEHEDVLRRTFPFDTIEPVPKGIHGGDVLQRVNDASGMECGVILWESKRTKAWSDSWLPKLRDDQRAAKAQVSVLVSIELPKGITTFGYIDGVWVTNRACALGLVAALRAGLIEVACAKRSLEGRQEKMEILYKYLSGAEFRHRVQGVVEAFVTLREDLEAEKRAMQRIWAKREKQLDRAVTNTAGFYGDLSGIIGASLPQIEQLDLTAIAYSGPDDADQSKLAPGSEDQP